MDLFNFCKNTYDMGVICININALIQIAVY